jgi:selenocysteine lyase/cysteine desulfurase
MDTHKTRIINTPYGKRHIIYADYTASGKSYHKIEKFIKHYVLPYYANTHSNAYCGKLMAKYIKASKQQIKKSLNCVETDKIIFTGSGTSCATTHFIHLLDFKKGDKNVVIISEFEHNSNFLPWRHEPVDLQIVKNLDNGLIDLDDLERILIKYQKYDKKIIACSAGSNITGIKQNTNKISILGHQFGFKVAFDYAAVGPYVKINMHTLINEYDYIDAIYLSPHKFLGGPGTPGLLVANECIFLNNCPYFPSGGTVRYTSKSKNIYSNNLEVRESGGTPNIIGCIRMGFVFQLKDKLQEYIIKREKEIVCKIKQELKKINNITLLNPECDPNITQIPIYSFVVHKLHYNYVVALLNDLFGIQSRGGVSCSGIYAQQLLDINKKDEQQIINTIVHDEGVPREYGWIRITFHYTMTDFIINYIIKAIDFVSNYGHLFLNQYQYDKNNNIWSHKYYKEKEVIYDYNVIDHHTDILFTKEDGFKYIAFAYKLIKNKEYIIT